MKPSLKLIKKLLIIILLLFVIIFFSGCWGGSELSDISLVEAMGIDVGANNDIKLTVLASIPTNPVISPAAQKSDMWIGTATGKSISEAMINLNATSSNSLIWFDNTLIVIGSDAAKTVLPELADFVSRDKGERFSTKILITQGKANEMLSIPSDLEPDLPDEIDGIITDNQDWSNSYTPTMKDFLIEMYSDSEDGMLGEIGIKMTPDNTFSTTRQETDQQNWLNKEFGSAVVEGCSIIKRGAFVGFLDEAQTRACLIIMGKANGSQITITPDNNKLVMNLWREKPQIKPVLIGNKIDIDINLEVDGILTETTEKSDLMEINNIDKIEKLFENELKDEMVAAVTKLQKDYKSDALGFGDFIKDKYPKQWKQIEPYWSRYYQNMKINYNVKVIIRRFGKSYELD